MWIPEVIFLHVINCFLDSLGIFWDLKFGETSLRTTYFVLKHGRRIPIATVVTEEKIFLARMISAEDFMFDDLILQKVSTDWVNMNFFKPQRISRGRKFRESSKYTRNTVFCINTVDDIFKLIDIMVAKTNKVFAIRPWSVGGCLSSFLAPSFWLYLHKSSKTISG